jgi:Bacterial Ig domain/Secretion system C-terminal sorting domain/PA14 domain/HYR domain
MNKINCTPIQAIAVLSKKLFKHFISFAFVALVLATNVSIGQNLTQSGFTSVLTPQFMASGSATRLPVMFRATVSGLTASTVYRYFVQGATNSIAGGGAIDFGTTGSGAGVSLLISEPGTTYTLVAGVPNVTIAGSFETFTTDGSGNYTGWFGFVNTGNGRFTAGNLVYPAITIGNTSGTILFRRALDVSITVLAYSTSPGANNGSFLKETSSGATPKNLAAIYDNIAGTGSPLFISPVESTGATITSAIAGYTTAGGGWNAIIPNTNANGVRRIEQRSVTSGAIVGCETDADGVWPTGTVNTANPTAGTGGLTISPADAVLSACVPCGIITVTATAVPISCPGGTTIIFVNATGGTGPYTGTGAFTVSAGTYNYTVTDSKGCTGTTSITVAVPLDTTPPGIYLKASGLLPGITGSSTTQTPYLLPTIPGVKFGSILSVNDVIGGYRMAGIPDGLGAFDNNDGTFTLLVNHEIVKTLGVPRAHGQKGAFVSKWIINKSTLAVQSGSDLMQNVNLWDTTTHTFITYNTGNPSPKAIFGRFCSADLPPVAAFYNSATGLGTTERIFMNGEETDDESRQMAHIATGANSGTSWELPALGKASWENSVASPATGNKTVVAEMNDGTDGQVYIYIGTKTNTGTEIQKAGLTNGRPYGIKVTGFPVERVNITTINPPPAPGTHFDLVDLGDVTNITGASFNTISNTNAVTKFSRPEDGAWDPLHPADFYFNTTDQIDQVADGVGAQVGRSRVWHLHFTDITQPELGGTVEAVIDGTEGANMLDNMAIDKSGHLITVEDVGNSAHLGKIWQYNIATDSFFQVGKHDPARFGNIGVPATAPFNQDEESSGVIDASEILGPGMFLIDVQAHYAPAANTAEVVEGGQLLVMYNPLSFGPGTAPDTIRTVTDFASSTATVALGTPATADNCSVASLTNNAPSVFPIGTTIVTWTVTDGSGNTATANQVVIVTLRPNIAPRVTITSPADGATFPAGSTITATAAASDTDGHVVKVAFYDGPGKFAEDTTSPYQVTGTDVEPGTYVLTAKAYDDRGDSTVSDTVRITVTACAGSGTISAEGYTNIPGSLLVNLASSPKYPAHPDVVTELSKFEYGPNLDDNYGGRVRGYICAPTTGNYVFYIASDEQSELWLSTDENPVNIVRIAYVNTRVNFRSWYTYASQKSVPIRLIKGAKYYIESVHKEGTGADHLSVGWVLPNGVFEGPVPGSRLSPAAPLASRPEFGLALRAASAAQEPINSAKKLEISAAPNPSSGYFTLKTRSNSDEALVVILTDLSGRVVEKRTQVPANGTLQIGSKLLTGVYFVEVVQGTQRERLKLVKQ